MKIIKILLLIVMVCVAVAFASIWKVGAWHLLFPSDQHDTVAPELPKKLAKPAILVFSKTNSFRHDDGIAGGRKALESIAAQHQWGVFATENGAVFNEQDLARFDVVVFLSASGDVLNEQQEGVFQSWLQAGGGWLGIHAAGDDSHKDWPWYVDTLIGANFTAHPMNPQFQRATVRLENRQHPVLKGLPENWQHEEEWYSWEKSPRGKGFTILATIDEASYSPVQKFMGKERDLHMGDHPVVWSKCVGSGRSVYAAMGHKAEAFEQPQFRQLLDNALSWLIADSADDCTQAAEGSAISSR
jgi:type 1 glutamine amidotransferase